MINKKICHVSIAFYVLLSTIAYSGIAPDSDENDTNSTFPAKNVTFRLNTMCGPNCVWQIAKAFGKDFTPKEIADFAGTNTNRGTTIKGIVEACKKIGLPVEAVKTNLQELTADPRVPILLLDDNNLMHYVILDNIGEDKVCLLDGSKFRDISIKELKSIWDGYAILVGNNDKPLKERIQRYFGRSLQISGLLILLVVTIYSVRSVYTYMTKRQY